MCGIVGVIGSPRADGEPPSAELVRRLSTCLATRGPDGEGVWTEPEAGVALGHRRLSIIDLSAEGAQPMHSADGRHVLVFNGEIYNYRDLRRELGDTVAWRGHSDTEVLLAAIGAWGLEGALQRCNGMFAFGLWDRARRELHLCRDRIGEKPLYYGRVGEAFVFASQLGAITAHPEWRGQVDQEALAAYTRFGYVPAPLSIYRGVRKLLPGEWLTVPTLDGRVEEGRMRSRRYWTAADAVIRARAEAFDGTPDEAVDALEALLGDAVALRMESDVPLGAFLSGGIDSSTVVALMQARSSRPIRTFCVGFDEDGYSEAVHARAVAAHLGTDHTEIVLQPRDAQALIPRLPHIYDEPFADSSQLATYFVSALARHDVTVVLSGDGGDELFGGYNRYLWAPAIWRRVGWLPRRSRRMAAGAMHALSAATWDGIYRAAGRVLPARLRVSHPGDSMHKLADVLPARHRLDMYEELTTLWRKDAGVVTHRGTSSVSALEAMPIQGDFAEQMMYRDLVGYLPDDILVKVDRATMAVSLEGRVPFLDHRVVEFAWRLPTAHKLRGGIGKRPVRQLLYRHVPRALLERPKRGFGVPVGAWLRGGLREWAQALLDPRRIESDGHLDAAVVGRAWREHQTGRRDHTHRLWSVLMFQAWLDAQRHGA